MSDLEKSILDSLFALCPRAEKIEFRASISDRSHSIEFFATENGQRKQCYDLADEGVLPEESLDVCFRTIAAFVRRSDTFAHGKMNEYKGTGSKAR